MVNKIHDLNIFGKEWIPKKNYFWMKLCAETMKENFLDSHLFYRAEKITFILPVICDRYTQYYCYVYICWIQTFMYVSIQYFHSYIRFNSLSVDNIVDAMRRCT